MTGSIDSVDEYRVNLEQTRFIVAQTDRVVLYNERQLLPFNGYDNVHRCLFDLFFLPPFSLSFYSGHGVI